MRELFNGKDSYVIINYSNRTHLIRHNVTRAFEDDYKNGKLETILMQLRNRIIRQTTQTVPTMYRKRFMQAGSIKHQTM